ncbi:MAG: hypothetical protein H6742_02525 [Alphaproteobacteria bacterium]|nr:hypothetical protein [Alphaproteobacteria bacterium]
MKSANLVTILALATTALWADTAEARGYGHGSHAERPERGPTAYDLGTVTIDNDRRETVQIYIDRGYAGDVAGDSRRSFQVQAGRHYVEVRDSHGRVLERSELTLHPGDQDLVRVDAAMGTLRVDNLTGAAMSLSLDGRSLGTLAPGQTRLVQAEEGGHALKVTYRQLGVTRVLTDLSVRLDPRRENAVALRAPDFGLVAVQNPLDRTVEVRVDGRTVATLRPRERREIQVGLGRRELELRLDGRSVARELRTIRPFEDECFEPRVVLQGQLFVDNDTRRDLQVFVDGRAMGWMDAHETIRLVVDAGSHRVEARTESGHEVFEAQIHLEPDEIERIEVDVRHERYGRVAPRPNGWGFGYRDGHFGFYVGGDALSYAD